MKIEDVVQGFDNSKFNFSADDIDENISSTDIFKILGKHFKYPEQLTIALNELHLDICSRNLDRMTVLLHTLELEDMKKVFAKKLLNSDENYIYNNKIKDAMKSGLLDCKILNSAIKKASYGKEFMRISVTDGIDCCGITIWYQFLEEYGKDYFSDGTNLSLRVNYNERFGFSLKEDYPIIKLPSIQEQERINKYVNG